VTAAPAIPSRDLRWSWEGKEISIGIDEVGEGPPVLVLPALSSISTRREMHPLMRLLGGQFRLLAADWPGFGDRPRPAIEWTPDALSAFLEHFLQHEMPPLLATIAAGHAASYALHLAAKRTGALGRLILLAPTWRGPLPTVAGGDRPLFHRIRRAIGFPLLGPMLYRLNVNRPVVHMMVAGHVYSDGQFLSGQRLREKRAVIAAPGARFGSAAFVTGGLDRLGSRSEFLEMARRANTPILVAYGAETPPRSRAEMEALAGLPGIRSFAAPRGKLAFYEEFAAGLVQPLTSFLLERSAAGPGTMNQA
jgi:pimeloyl-ACP methyl ester carboxylesterase